MEKRESFLQKSVVHTRACLYYVAVVAIRGSGVLRPYLRQVHNELKRGVSRTVKTSRRYEARDNVRRTNDLV